MEAREFVKELNRMMDSRGRTGGICEGVACSNCELAVSTDCVLFERRDFEALYKTIEIVEEWSKEHPKRTNKEVLFEKFPGTRTNPDGSPTVCAYHLGIVSDRVGCKSCSECWNQEYKGVDVDGGVKQNDHSNNNNRSM